ncbi:uncharacterized protein LOC132805130 [Ziziphus jujuba]|uniref:Uncharacterized protein LOC132805130 n=1 Tax=Ziziphus jujuba TaxID=326968 RepID=A0ABM4AGT8_ZIZJJ|nr:uncharacterized protein LOC132805130 [Ziziphus jujuba]
MVDKAFHCRRSKELTGHLHLSDKKTRFSWTKEEKNNLEGSATVYQKLTEMKVGGSGHNIRGVESRRTWSIGEEDALLFILDEVVASGQRCNTESFKPGTITMIERRLAKICPNSGLQVNPHIESKMKKWKKQYGIIYDMLNKSGLE